MTETDSRSVAANQAVNQTVNQTVNQAGNQAAVQAGNRPADTLTTAALNHAIPTVLAAPRVSVPIRIEGQGQIPLYASGLAAGCDLFATRDMVLRPGETRLMPLDLTIALPPGVEAQIRPRSGLSLKTDLRLPNAPGTVDADYRNPVGVILQNIFNPAHLPGLIAADPSLLLRICRTHRPVRLGEFLQHSRPDWTAQLADLLSAWPGDGLAGGPLAPLLDETLFLDAEENPYGTIYIRAGDRIAQMVLASHLQADFIEHPAPETIGADRGGGFGSTGLNTSSSNIGGRTGT